MVLKQMVRGTFAVFFAKLKAKEGEALIKIKNRTMIIPKEERIIGVSGDQKTDTRQFQIPRDNYNNIDLSAMNFSINLKLENETIHTIVPLTKAVTEESIVLTWLIKAHHCRAPGTWFGQIEAYNTDSTVVWHSFEAPFYVEEKVDMAAVYTNNDMLSFQEVLSQCQDVLEAFKAGPNVKWYSNLSQLEFLVSDQNIRLKDILTKMAPQSYLITYVLPQKIAAQDLPYGLKQGGIIIEKTYVNNGSALLRFYADGKQYDGVYQSSNGLISWKEPAYLNDLLIPVENENLIGSDKTADWIPATVPFSSTINDLIPAGGITTSGPIYLDGAGTIIATGPFTVYEYSNHSSSGPSVYVYTGQTEAVASGEWYAAATSAPGIRLVYANSDNISAYLKDSYKSYKLNPDIDAGETTYSIRTESLELENGAWIGLRGSDDSESGFSIHAVAPLSIEHKEENDVEIKHAESGITAGTYGQVEVDKHGHVTGGEKILGVQYGGTGKNYFPSNTVLTGKGTGDIYLRQLNQSISSDSSDDGIPTSAAVYKAVQGALSEAGQALQVKGAVSTSNPLPQSDYKAGWTYIVSEAGTYANEQCEAGDMLICVCDYSGTNTDNDWIAIQRNIDIATTTTAGMVKSVFLASGVVPQGYVYVEEDGKMYVESVSFADTARTALGVKWDSILEKPKCMVDHTTAVTEDGIIYTINDPLVADLENGKISFEEGYLLTVTIESETASGQNPIFRFQRRYAGRDVVLDAAIKVYDNRGDQLGLAAPQAGLLRPQATYQFLCMNAQDETAFVCLGAKNEGYRVMTKEEYQTAAKEENTIYLVV